MRNKKRTFRGIPRNVNWRKAGKNWDILTFRIERIDNEGSYYVPVTMEGLIKGNVVEEDKVEVTGKIDRDGLLNAESIIFWYLGCFLRNAARKTCPGLKLALIFKEVYHVPK